MCTHRTHVARTVCKLVHTKRILFHFCVVAGTVRKSSAHDVTLKMKVILFQLDDARIQRSRNMPRGQNFAGCRPKDWFCLTHK